MNLRLVLVLAVALSALFNGRVNADPVSGLYAADVAVRDQSADTRAAALQDALAQVLVKVTGSQSVLETETARELLDNPARYLQQYRYESVRPVPVDPDALRLALHTEFDGAALERKLRGAGLSLWGRERPLTLAWVALGESRELIGADSRHPVVDALRRASTRRGLPFVLPTLDAEDTTRVSFMDVWGVFEEPLQAAAMRYSPDAIYAGNIFNAGNELWAGRWTLLRDGQRQRFELSGASPEAVAVAAIDQLAEHFSQEFSVQAGFEQGQVAMDVIDVTSLQDYARVQRYLAGLSTVKDVRLLAVDGEQLRFELDLNGSVRSLEQAIALGRVLEALPKEELFIRLGGESPSLQPGSTETGPTGTEPANGLPETLPAEPQAAALRYRYRG